MTHPAKDWVPGRLYSLGEIMREFKIDQFLLALNGVLRVRGRIEQSAVRSFPPDKKHPDNASFFADIEALAPQIDQLGIGALTAAAKRLQLSAQGKATYDQLGSEIDYLNGGLTVFFDGKTVLIFDVSKEAYYKNPRDLLGFNTWSKFPNARREITEAGKCFALHRFTASVFHLMRVAELGVKAVAQSLQIPDPIKPAEKSWGHALGSIRKERERRSKNNGWSNSQDEDFFSSIYFLLDAAKEAFRDPTMHIEKDFDEIEAEGVFNSMKGFMSKLSSRVDEAGNPHA